MNKYLQLFALAFLFPLLIVGQVLNESNIPIVVINTFGVSIPDEPKIPGTMKIVDNGPGQINHVTDSGNVYQGNIGIEIRGHFSAILPQKPYAIETRDSVQNELNVPLFGFPEEHDWVLLANYNDKVFMRNTLAFSLFNQMGSYASRTRFCEVIVNGSYDGIYIFGEKIKRDNGRVDIAKLDENENSGEPMSGGYIFKLDYWDWSNSWQSNFHPIDHPELDVHYVYEYPDFDVITPAQKTYIKNYVNSFESALYSNNFTNPVFGYSPYIDKFSFINYFIVNELSRNNDGFKKSYFFHKDRDFNDRRIKSGPVWDFDWAWKNIDECEIFRKTDGSGWAYLVNDCAPDVNSPGWMVRILQDPEFANELKCRYLFLRTNILSSDSLISYIDQTVAYLNEAQQRHYQRWPILGLNVGTPVIGPIPTTFQGEILSFKSWIIKRLNWMDLNMPGTCTTTGLQKAESPIPFLFPNPAKDYFYLEIPGTNQLIDLRLTDMNGKMTSLKFNRDGEAISADIHSIPNGIYTVIPVLSGKKFLQPMKLIILH
jgi:hypothetical protein